MPAKNYDRMVKAAMATAYALREEAIRLETEATNPVPTEK